MGEATDVKTSFVNLLANMKENTGSTPLLRIGGNSAEKSSYETNPFPPSVNISFIITQEDLLRLGSLASALPDIKIILGTNMVDPSNASASVDYVQGMIQVLGQGRQWPAYLYAIEIGNEPDLYGDNGVRPTNYSFTEYLTEWQMYAAEIQKLDFVPKKIFQGATFCCTPSFLESWSKLIKATFGDTLAYSQHLYPLTACNGNQVTIQDLLEGTNFFFDIF